MLISGIDGNTISVKLMAIRCGEIKRLVMGLDRYQKTPCGFCFVEYYSHQDALDCMKYIGGTKLDERIIRTDLDPGFEEGRQYGYVAPLGCVPSTMADYISVAESRAGKLETSTGTNTIPAEVATAERSTKNVRGKKRATGQVGNTTPG